MLKVLKNIMFIIIVFQSCYALSQEMQTVKHVDLKKYMGKWYEVARLPNSFQRNCTCTTAQYKFKSSDEISVVNSCIKKGKLSVAKGTAWQENAHDTSKLKVQFFWPFSGKYWILYLSKDYKYAVVGEPSRDFLWFLSRTKQVSPKQMKIMKEVALKNNYKLNNLLTTKNYQCK